MNKLSQKITTLMIIAAIITAAIPLLITTSEAQNTSDWSITTNSRVLKAYPNLQETIWQKDTNMAPHGTYDKIGLHRIVKTGVTPIAVVLYLPGTYGSGELMVSNPVTDNWTLTENESQCLYLANRGYDVYGVDYRTHFVPDSLNPINGAINSSQLSFMANWGWDQWISDINEAVNKVKAVSGANAIYLAGASFGGRATMNYATLYPQNLRGIILLDGGNASANASPANQYNLTASLLQDNLNLSWYMTNPNLAGSTPLSPQFKYIAQFTLANPGAPALNPFTNASLNPPANPMTGRPFANITDWFTFIFQYVGMTNVTGGNMNPTTLVRFFSSMDMFWPNRLNLEYNAYMGWTNCPYVTKDFDDSYKNVSLPLIGFVSQNYGLPKNGPIGSIGTTDVTRTILFGYGHIDVFEGINSAKDVNEPVYQWLLNHTLLASITQGSSNVIDTKSSQTLSVNASGGQSPYTYQWYGDSTPISGQTTAQINVAWTTAGVHTYYATVKDATGNVANSTAFTLTINAASATSTPTPIITTAPTNMPTPIPTSQPTQTTTPTENPTATPNTTTPTATPETSQLSFSGTLLYSTVVVIVLIVIAIAAFLIKKNRV